LKEDITVTKPSWLGWWTPCWRMSRVLTV
jgi:hypothetical protein